MTRTKRPGRGWAYTGAILGGLVSIAANVAHSFLPPHNAPPDWAPEPGAVVGAIVWPVFLFIAVEILARTAWPHGWSWHVLRWAGLLPVAGVAAFVSYRHLSGLLAHYGEEPIVQVIGPLAVDGLMIMATAALLAGGRAASITAHVPTASTVAPVQPSTPPALVPPAAPAPMPVTPPNPAPVAAEPPPAVTTPAAVPNPAHVKARVQARQQTGAPTAKRAASTTDIPVTASDPAPPTPKVAPGQLARARHLVEAHHTGTGAAITAGELAVRMRISTERASRLLAALNASVSESNANRTDALNGTPVADAAKVTTRR
jgi:hypothetical protein